MPDLTDRMRDLLWAVAQMKYGWAHVRRFGGEMQVADALVRRGLVEWGRNGREHPDPRVVATEAGRAEIERRWPVSPFVLDTYEHQPGGWTPREGAVSRRRAVHVDLTGSNCGLDFLSVDVVLDAPWTDERIREEAARYYAVPLEQVGEPREPDDDDPWADDAESCARLLVGQGSDTYDPECVLPRGHGGACSPAEVSHA